MSLDVIATNANEVVPDKINIYRMKPEPIHALGTEEPVAKVDTLVKEELDFAYVGPDGPNDEHILRSGQFAPLFEMDSRDVTSFNRRCMHDGQFRSRQAQACGRLHAWQDSGQDIDFNSGVGDEFAVRDLMTSARAGTMTFNTNTTTATASTSANVFHDFTTATTFATSTATGSSTGIGSFNPSGYWRMTDNDLLAGNDFMLSDRHYAPSADFTKQLKIREALEDLFTKASKRIFSKMSDYEKELYRAKLKSEQLLKSMLSPNEYRALKFYGELEIPDITDPNVLYIVKKRPHEMVTLKNKFKEDQRLCVVAKNEYRAIPVGDQILQKIMLLKTNPARFKKIAGKF